MINTCKELAIEAGKAIMEIYRDNNFNVRTKIDATPITMADERANKIICRGLSEAFPEIPIISEENALVQYSIRKTYQKCWMIDPLDGTKEFINRNGEFTVNIALVDGERPVLGVVYSPVREILAWGLKEEGSFQESDKGREKLRVKSFAWNQNNIRVLCSRSHLDTDTRKYLEQLVNPNILPSGSSWKFIKIARGEGDVYPRFAPTMEWDTCAADIILEEAGGVVKSQDDGKPMRYNKENLINPNFIAHGGTI